MFQFQYSTTFQICINIVKLKCQIIAISEFNFYFTFLKLSSNLIILFQFYMIEIVVQLDWLNKGMTKVYQSVWVAHQSQSDVVLNFHLWCSFDKRKIISQTSCLLWCKKSLNLVGSSFITKNSDDHIHPISSSAHPCLFSGLFFSIFPAFFVHSCIVHMLWFGSN